MFRVAIVLVLSLGCAAGPGGGQCAWSAGACSTDATYLSNLMPSSGGGMMDAYVACTAMTTEGTCVETKSCAWSGEECELELSPWNPVFLSLLDSSGCGGWGVPMVEARKCALKAASHSDCSAANMCQVTQGYLQYESGKCPGSETDVCWHADLDSLICPAINMSKSSWRDSQEEGCKQALRDDFNIADPTDERDVDWHKWWVNITSCVHKACPILRELETAIASAESHCIAKTTEDSCEMHGEPCYWSGECKTTERTSLSFSLPDTCKIKGLLVAWSKCDARRSQSQCTGSCKWDRHRSCWSPDGWYGGCYPSSEQFYRHLEQGGSSKDALSLLNVDLVGANCEAQTDEASCASVVQQLATATDEAGRAPRTTDTTFVIAMIGLVLLTNNDET